MTSSEDQRKQEHRCAHQHGPARWKKALTPRLSQPVKSLATAAQRRQKRPKRPRIEQKDDRTDVESEISGIRPTWASATPHATWAAGERPFEGCPDRTRRNGARPASGPRARTGSAP